jgi:RNA polymerase sigma-70 factor (ECF subfamily)
MLAETLIREARTRPVMPHPQPPATEVVDAASPKIAAGAGAVGGEWDLARRFAEGDLVAGDEVIRRYSPRIGRLCQRMLAWPDDVADVVQETFVAALAARSRFRGQSRLETWLVRIAINCCRAHRRKKWLRRKLFAAWQARETAAGAAGLEIVGGPDTAVRREQAEEVRRAVAALPQKSREVVVLYYLEEMTAAEVAEALNLRPNTVEVRLNRARKQLADALKHLE